jgi:hypothetical protein
MEKLSDKEILKNVMTALGVKIPEFRKNLKYNSNTTIYNVLKNVHGISGDMMNRIMQAYPEVSYLYLKRGQGVPLKVGPSVTNQKNIFGLENPEELISIKEFLMLPSKVAKLEELVISLRKEIEELKSGKN